MDERLQALESERTSLESKLRRLGELELSRADRLSLVEECRAFLHDLPGLLDSASPETRVRALRRCVEGIVVDREAGSIDVRVRPLPVGSLSNGSTESISLVF